MKGKATEAAELNAKRDQEVLALLLKTYGSDLSVPRRSISKQANALHSLTQQVGHIVAKTTIAEMLRGTPPKISRQTHTYEGLALVFAALEPRLIGDGDGHPNCFELEKEELEALTSSYQRPAQRENAVSDGLARMRVLNAARQGKKKTALPAIAPGGPNERYPSYGTYASTIFDNWQKPAYWGPTNIIPGFYQIFRIYKPERELTNLRNIVEPPKKSEVATGRDSPIGNYGGPDLRNHPVVCELIYVNPKKMECILVTSERNKYIGTLHINHESILFGVLQRRPVGANGWNHRFICMELLRLDLAYHSGLMIKVGHKTTRPVSSECLFVRIKRENKEHEDLYSEREKLRETAEDGEQIAADSIMARYVTPNPPISTPYDPATEGWKHVKFVRDFPALFHLSKIQGSDDNKYRLLREPSRTMEKHTLTVLQDLKEMTLPPYRREDS